MKDARSHRFQISQEWFFYLERNVKISRLTQNNVKISRLTQNNVKISRLTQNNSDSKVTRYLQFGQL